LHAILVKPRMFQTDIVVALQAFGSDCLTRALLAITVLGYSEFQIPLLIVLAFGVNLRKGLILVQIILVTSILTEYLKVWFALPRPTDVDPAVSYVSGGVESIEASAFYQDAPTFLSTLPMETIRLLRNSGIDGYGFPSGHSSGTAALCAALGLLFKRRIWWLSGTAAVILVAFSRIYLGRHFLADVLGGIVLGLGVVACFTPILRRRAWSRIENTFALLASSQWGPGLTLYFFSLPVLGLALATPLGAEDAGRLLGINAGFFLTARNGLPDDQSSLARRLGRVILAGLYYLSINAMLEMAAGQLVSGDTQAVKFAVGGLTTFLMIVSSVETATRLKLYEVSHRFALVGRRLV
jgi:membrane-associated phospholipid phosphatase